MTLVIIAAGCAGVDSGNRIVPPAPWQPPALPESPPPIPSVGHFFGLPPPHYPEKERLDGVYGDVLLVITVDAAATISDWKIVRASSEGYAREVTRSFKARRGVAKGVPPGTYSLDIAFCGDLETGDRPGVFWVSVEPFGR